MAALYTIAEVADAAGGRIAGRAEGAVSSISIDSRDIAPGALFVAIKGDNFDGHDFVAKAIEAGAVAALVSENRADGLEGLPLIVVEDALEGLYGLARFARARSTASIVAVTGSVGKTSTKEAIRVALCESGKTHASIKSFNNHWGVPLMLARMPIDAQFGVFEIGMNHAGEITPLSELVRPHVAVITTVAPVHLEFFDSVAAIADAKGEILAGVEPGGAAILGQDHPHIGRLIDRAQAAGVSTLTYGFEADADIRITGYTATGQSGIARIYGDGLEMSVSVGAPGRHAVANAVAALLASRAVGGDLEKAAVALASHGAPEGRGATLLLGPPERPLHLIDESYNANPLAMRAALEIFGQISANGGRKVLVLGDMLEMGPQSHRYHAELADAVIAAKPDLVFTVGSNMDALADALPPHLVAGRTQRTEDMTENVLQALAYGDSVMLKGSNGVRLGALVARIRERFGAST